MTGQPAAGRCPVCGATRRYAGECSSCDGGRLFPPGTPIGTWDVDGRPIHVGDTLETPDGRGRVYYDPVMAAFRVRIPHGTGTQVLVPNTRLRVVRAALEDPR